MSQRTNIVYEYDGTFAGFLCCVFESFAQKELPFGIISQEEEQIPLAPVKEIETDRKKAERVYRSIERKMSASARELIEMSFLTCVPQKEREMLDFFYLGYRYGKQVMNRLTDPTVDCLLKGVKHLTNEAHFTKEFLRFSMRNRMLVAKIGPKNNVLTLIKDHFAARFPNENFLIYDCKHHLAFLHTPRQSGIIPAEEIELEQIDEEERYYQRLWKLFYRTVAIKERYNPRCRMSHMPKRYWEYMTEFQEEEPVSKQDKITDTDFSVPTKLFDMKEKEGDSKESAYYK